MKKINKKLCMDCGGHCCKKMPGATFPSDFGKSKKEIMENVRKILATGKFGIDWWEAEKPRYYVRPKTQGESKLFNSSWGGVCIFFNQDKGCNLNFRDRPRECRYLIAGKPEKSCLTYAPPSARFSNNKEGASLAWQSFNDFLVSFEK